MGLAPSLLSRLPTPDVAGLFKTGKRREDTPSLFSRFQMQLKKEKSREKERREESEKEEGGERRKEGGGREQGSEGG